MSTSSRDDESDGSRLHLAPGVGTNVHHVNHVNHVNHANHVNHVHEANDLDDAASRGGLEVRGVGHFAERMSPYEAIQRQRAILLRIVRMGFFILTLTFTFLALLQARDSNSSATQRELAITWWVPVLFGVGLFVFAVLIDLGTPKKKLSTIAGVFFGVLAGMLATIAIGFLVDLLLESWVANREAIVALKPVVNSFKILLGISLCYLGISTVLQTQDDFRLVIPYVEFSKQLRGVRPLLLDTSSLIDGRIADIAQTNFLLVPLVIPRFVLDELQRLCDSQDASKRVRGKRGLDMAARLQRLPKADVSIDETQLPIKSVDQMLIELARAMPALIVTADVGLARVAQLQGVSILNLNDLANALKPSLIPGSTLSVRLMRVGEQPTQGVGYLDDGTMVVAEDGAPRVGQTVSLVVTGALQTSGGRLIFARLNEVVRVDEASRGQGEVHSARYVPALATVLETDNATPPSQITTQPQSLPQPQPLTSAAALPTPNSAGVPAANSTNNTNGTNAANAANAEARQPALPTQNASPTPIRPLRPGQLPRTGTPRNPRR